MITIDASLFNASGKVGLCRYAFGVSGNGGSVECPCSLIFQTPFKRTFERYRAPSDVLTTSVTANKFGDKQCLNTQTFSDVYLFPSTFGAISLNGKEVATIAVHDGTTPVVSSPNLIVVGENGPYSADEIRKHIPFATRNTFMGYSVTLSGPGLSIKQGSSVMPLVINDGPAFSQISYMASNRSINAFRKDLTRTRGLVWSRALSCRDGFSRTISVMFFQQQICDGRYSTSQFRQPFPDSSNFQFICVRQKGKEPELDPVNKAYVQSLNLPLSFASWVDEIRRNPDNPFGIMSGFPAEQQSFNIPVIGELKGSIVDPNLVLQTIKPAIGGTLDKYSKIYRKFLTMTRDEPNPFQWSELVRDCMDNMGLFDSNGIAYLKDLKSIGAEIKDIMSLVTDIDNPKKWASAWLSCRFGTKLTWADTRQLIRAFQKKCARSVAQYDWEWSFTKGRCVITDLVAPKGTILDGIANYKMYYDSRSRSEMIGIIKNLGEFSLLPSATNIWDMIPLSFVVDWLVPVGDLLDQVDDIWKKELYDILAVTYSTKLNLYVTDLERLTSATIDFLAKITAYAENPLLNNVEMVYSSLSIKDYGRFCQSTAHPLVPTPRSASMRPINFVDAASLLIQRL